MPGRRVVAKTSGGSTIQYSVNIGLVWLKCGFIIFAYDISLVFCAAMTVSFIQFINQTHYCTILSRWSCLPGQPNYPISLHLPTQLLLMWQRKCWRPPRKQHLSARPWLLRGRGRPQPALPVLPISSWSLQPHIPGEPELSEPSTTGLINISQSLHEILIILHSFGRCFGTVINPVLMFSFWLNLTLKFIKWAWLQWKKVLASYIIDSHHCKNIMSDINQFYWSVLKCIQPIWFLMVVYKSLLFRIIFFWHSLKVKTKRHWNQGN